MINNSRHRLNNIFLLIRLTKIFITSNLFLTKINYGFKIFYRLGV